MATKTYAQLTEETTVQDADLLASYRATGPLKRLTALRLKTYAQVGALLVDGSAPMTGGLAAYYGTEGSPGVTFNGDSDTGLYRVGVNSFGASAGGVCVALFNSAGISAIIGGTTPNVATFTTVSATSINNVAITAPATAATLTIANNKTLTVNNSLTFTGTDGSSVAFGAGGTVAYLGTAQTFTAAQTTAVNPGGADVVALRLKSTADTAGNGLTIIGDPRGLGDNTRESAIVFRSGTAAVILQTNPAGTRLDRFTLNADGSIRFNAYGAGTLVTDSSGNVTPTSDVRLKNLKRRFTAGLNEILALDDAWVFTTKLEEGQIAEAKAERAQAVQARAKIKSADFLAAEALLASADETEMEEEHVVSARALAEKAAQLDDLINRHERQASFTDVPEYVSHTAQQMQAVFGELAARPGPDGYLGYDNRPVIAALTTAVKQLHARLEEAERRIAAAQYT